MTVKIIRGDCREVLASLPRGSVHCCVTSPPYYGLRDYKVAGQIGLEQTPDEFIAEMVAVFRAVWRVLRDDGTCWLNLGDSYANDGKWGGSSGGKHVSALHGKSGVGRQKQATGAKPKDLLMMPARVALALQADGWWIRSDIIWAKPNPMPESVTDRPTSAHEHVFLLSKAERYFYDTWAVREEASAASLARVNQKGFAEQKGGPKDYGANGVNSSRSMRKTLENFALNPGRNLRNVWDITPQPYSGAHFATMPPDLAERCILAGTSERGCCPDCGAPWERLTNKSYVNPGNRTTNGPRSIEQRHETAGFAVRLEKRVETTGWWPTCKCPTTASPVPCTVIDPFGGAGTTGLVADRLQRNAVLIELNPEYADLAENRIHGDAGLFAEVASG